MKLLVLTIDGYQDIELVSFIGTLNACGQFDQIDYWNPDGQENVFGSNQIGVIKTQIAPVNPAQYDAIFIPGGRACQNLRTNQNALNLIKQFIDLDKYVFAICDAPNALVDAKLMLDKKYVSYPIKNIEKVATSLRQTSAKTWVDGKYISGDSPMASIEMALLVIKTIFNDQLAQQTFRKINGY